ncbi:MAG: ABC transporter ATP-binding protein [Actinomycetota bacterium]|nr:ABC transporter ATP-binding protein [Acidimicrobiia bacterium]MDQ3294076.1 ABC transporter ATP-binding protein [Actinomycetota bacterium]
MALLEVRGVTVRFGGVTALDGVEAEVAGAGVTGLIGPNGAGKTTLFNVICGLQAPTSGRVLLDGDDLDGVAPHQRARLGIARTFQRLEVFGSMTVRDNIRVAAEVHRRHHRDGPPVESTTDSIVERVGLGSVARERVDSLPTGHARLVEVGRALAGQPRILLLDEPSSGLSEEETDAFATLLDDLIVDGLGILLVEHDVELVMRVCSHIHVLDFGRVIAAGDPGSIQKDELVRSAYLGAP